MNNLDAYYQRTVADISLLRSAIRVMKIFKSNFTHQPNRRFVNDSNHQPLTITPPLGCKT